MSETRSKDPGQSAGTCRARVRTKGDLPVIDVFASSREPPSSDPRKPGDD